MSESRRYLLEYACDKVWSGEDPVKWMGMINTELDSYLPTGDLAGQTWLCNFIFQLELHLKCVKLGDGTFFNTDQFYECFEIVKQLFPYSNVEVESMSRKIKKWTTKTDATVLECQQMIKDMKAFLGPIYKKFKSPDVMQLKGKLAMESSESPPSGAKNIVVRMKSNRVAAKGKQPIKKPRNSSEGVIDLSHEGSDTSTGEMLMRNEQTRFETNAVAINPEEASRNLMEIVKDPHTKAIQSSDEDTDPQEFIMKKRNKQKRLANDEDEEVCENVIAKKQRKVRHRKCWTATEVEWLWMGVEKYGVGNWTAIHNAYNFHNRNAVAMKDKYRNLLRNGQI